MKEEEEEEEETEEFKLRRNRFLRMVHALKKNDPEDIPENHEVVELLKGIAKEIKDAHEAKYGLTLEPVIDYIDENTIVDNRNYFLENNFDLSKKINEIMQSLPERERNILSLRFGLKDGYVKTLEEVGRQFKKTRERIREIENKAAKKMKHPERIKQLHAFIHANEKPRPEALKVFKRFHNPFL